MLAPLIALLRSSMFDFNFLSESLNESKLLLIEEILFNLVCSIFFKVSKCFSFAVFKELRSRSDSIGIIMLTAKSQEMDKISGLMIGADDYITKPFSPTELLARVDSLYRRVEMLSGKVAETRPADEITLGDFVLNIRRRTLTKRGVNIELTQVEFQIIEYFFTNPDVALDRTDILNRVWGDAYFGEEKIVDVNIRRLRMKIEDEPSSPRHLMTVWGMGYKWVAEPKA